MAPVAAADVKAGLRLSLIGTVVSGIVQFVFMMVLARLLTPADYGAYALCVAAVSLSALFFNNVIERTLVLSAPGNEERDESATIVLLSVAAGALALGGGALLARLELAPIVPGLLAIVALSVGLGALAITPRALLRRRVRFGPVVIGEFAAMAVGQGLVTIALARAGWGAYALAVGACAQSLGLALVLRLRAERLPLAPPSPARALNLVRSSVSLGGNAAAELLHGQAPGLLLGIRLGAAPLGLFNRSYSLVQIPIQLLVAALTRVSISALFALRDERERMHAAARLLVRPAALLVTPIAAGMAGASDNFIHLALGERWREAATIVPLVALSGWATMLGTLYGTVSEALRAFAERTRVQLATTLAMVVLALAGSRYGLLGATAGIAAGSVIYLLLATRLSARLLDRPFAGLLAWLLPGLCAGLPCFAFSLALGRWWEAPVEWVFAAQVSGCGALTLLLALAFYPATVLALIEVGYPPLLRRLPWFARLLRR